MTLWPTERAKCNSLSHNFLMGRLGPETFRDLFDQFLVLTLSAKFDGEGFRWSFFGMNCTPRFCVRAFLE